MLKFKLPTYYVGIWTSMFWHFQYGFPPNRRAVCHCMRPENSALNWGWKWWMWPSYHWRKPPCVSSSIIHLLIHLSPSHPKQHSLMLPVITACIFSLTHSEGWNTLWMFLKVCINVLLKLLFLLSSSRTLCLSFLFFICLILDLRSYYKALGEVKRLEWTSLKRND